MRIVLLGGPLDGDVLEHDGGPLPVEVGDAGGVVTYYQRVDEEDERGAVYRLDPIATRPLSELRVWPHSAV